jgi:hypothetical protein
MNILILKLALAPIIIGSASLAGRKWGPAVSGWIVGLPLTSGPVAFILAVSHDTTFAFGAIRGTLSGGFSLIAFCLTYAWLARKFNWVVTALGSMLVFTGMTALLQNIDLPLIPLFFAIVFVILFGLLLMPIQAEFEPSQSTPSRWDIPARVLVGTGFILLLTGIAPYIGPRLTGLLTTIPLYAGILTIFAHRQHGHAGANSVLRGLILGLFSFAGFYLVLGLLIQNTSLAVSFGASILSALIVQGLTLLILQKAHQQNQLQDV